jgi:alpha-L-fucosidase
MKSSLIIKLALSVTMISWLSAEPVGAEETNSAPFIVVNTTAEPVATGRFAPAWESLKQFRCPDWFRDAKFGIWAHWGPQCQPEDGDWYARWMYLTNSAQYRFHTNHYGSPAQFGFKDVIHEWKAERWDPEKLVALYKRAGAQYFFALANHHDNFDNWNSKYQPWNSVKIGPKKDLIGDWARAARANGLRFGVSVHASHAWTWYEPAQDFDGKLTRADGRGQWWDGFDPQDLYAQNHPPGPDYQKANSIHRYWNWGNGASLPDQAYCDRFYNRTADLINQYHPDLIYFDDNVLPLWPVSDAGLRLAAHFYNSNNRWHGTNNDGVLFGKILTPEQRQCLVWDIERGQANKIEPYPWQTDTCIGDWHYDRKLFEEHRYKTTRTVIQMLADIVSKNGNLLLSIPVRGDGTLDSDELEVVQGIADWMDANRECIFGTRPWKIFGEGPASGGPELKAQGFNEGRGNAFTAADFRFTVKGNVLYAIELGAPTNGAAIKSLGQSAGLLERPIKRIELLGVRSTKPNPDGAHLATRSMQRGDNEPPAWRQTPDALIIAQPKTLPNDFAVVFKITLK